MPRCQHTTTVAGKTFVCLESGPHGIHYMAAADRDLR